MLEFRTIREIIRGAVHRNDRDHDTMQMTILLRAAAIAAAGVLAGCATITQDEATISRFVEMPVAVVRPIIGTKLIQSGYQALSDTQFRKTIQREKDPVLGLIPVSDKPTFALLVTVQTEENGRGSMIRLLPEALFAKVLDHDSYNHILIRPESADHAALVALLDNAIAEARFVAAKAQP